MSIEGIIFDLDGVLVDTATYHFRSWQYVADELGIKLSHDIAEQLKGISRMHSLEIVLNEADIQCRDEEKEALAEKKNNWYLDSLKELEDSVILPGVINFLDHLTKQEVPLAVGSASENASFVLEKLDMTHYFQSIIDGRMVRKTKPDPEVFINSARNLQLSESSCIVFEDSQKGIKAAKAGGFKVIGIGNEETLSESDAVIPDFKDQTFASILALFH